MADQRAWWTLVISQEPGGPDDPSVILSDLDREHIAGLIENGFIQGEIVADPPGDHTLVWESAGTDEPGDQNANSVHRVADGATSALYSLGPALAAPSEDGERWDLELIQYDQGTEIGSTDLGRHPDEQTAKDYAQTWERLGHADPRVATGHVADSDSDIDGEVVARLAAELNRPPLTGRNDWETLQATEIRDQFAVHVVRVLATLGRAIADTATQDRPQLAAQLREARTLLVSTFARLGSLAAGEIVHHRSRFDPRAFPLALVQYGLVTMDAYVRLELATRWTYVDRAATAMTVALPSPDPA